jgi:hypothetical protein
MSLSLIHYSANPEETIGIPLLVSTASATAVDQTTQGVAFSGINFSSIASTATVDGFDTSKQLLMKVFLDTVKADSTGEYVVTVTGSAVPKTTSAHVYDTQNFGMTWGISNWSGITSADATVTVKPLLPMTKVSANCYVGLAPDGNVRN